MVINVNAKKLQNLPIVSALIDYLNTNQDALSLRNSNIYYDFPVFKDLDGEVIIAQLLLTSQRHGVILFNISKEVSPKEFEKSIVDQINNLDDIYSTIFSRLIRNKELRKDRVTLKFPIYSIVYAPNIEGNLTANSGEVGVFNKFTQIDDFFQANQIEDDPEVYKELKASIEGSKGLIIPNKRDKVKKDTRGDMVNELEQEIAGFDEFQKRAYMSVLTGASRIRGLAGSGKTVVLAMKAAITHLRDPTARIAYTFYTRSLYQHIKRLITRFYRQFDDKDPDWDKLEIIHAWGSSINPGVYYNACVSHQQSPMTFTEASKFSSRDAFGYACRTLLESKLDPVYDYIFIDEGQDFPLEFLRLCAAITTENKLIWAYDELQTIFQVTTPSVKEIFGTNEKGESVVELEEDIILYKCYRNPREILVTAHALGFGIYSGRIVQMIDSKEYWSDIGYVLENGKLEPGKTTILSRPEENSLQSISRKYPINEIIKCINASNDDEEVERVCERVSQDIKEGLLPEDILVITVDDRYATNYLSKIQNMLATKYGIKSNNMHSDKYSIKDFQVKGSVTLSTVYKAKGNEAYSVYIVGVDALYTLKPGIRDRNILFTAMTRSKAWVCLSGLGKAFEGFTSEVNIAFSKFPNLEFIYPTKSEMKIMQRDINENATRKSKTEKKLDDLLDELGEEGIKRFLEQRSKKKMRK